MEKNVCHTELAGPMLSKDGCISVCVCNLCSLHCISVTDVCRQPGKLNHLLEVPS